MSSSDKCELNLTFGPLVLRSHATMKNCRTRLDSSATLLGKNFNGLLPQSANQPITQLGASMW